MTLKEQAYNRLRQFILSGKIRPGEHLTELSLVEMLEMSRTPIRSAMERLASEGLVTYSPNRGLSVAEMTFDRVIDFFDYRMAIEGYAVRKLADRVWSEEEKEWFRINLSMQKRCVDAHDSAMFTQADSDFHRKLIYNYDNQEMIQTMDKLQDQLYLTALKVLRKDQSRIHQSYEDHKRIFELLVDGNAEEAGRLMLAHLEYGKRILVM
ncbi:GntR family transcriptional regulator [Paenibacillus swuensis]|uniref:GntR family transcriptional regulator n=1 Tax=Paenibacillus swuensis TaxID=1178515 RepID=A0A172TNE0_9BACL|nr:GntR family transcriptional regulator [Paenibacillus swuensis]ANE48540.1 GntR family transcriptional regulator [Paenibacillus swuensis]